MILNIQNVVIVQITQFIQLKLATLTGLVVDNFCEDEVFCTDINCNLLKFLSLSNKVKLFLLKEEVTPFVQSLNGCESGMLDGVGV